MFMRVRQPETRGGKTVFAVFYLCFFARGMGVDVAGFYFKCPTGVPWNKKQAPLNEGLSNHN